MGLAMTEFFITEHVVDRFVERFGHKFKKEIRKGQSPYFVVKTMLFGATEDASVMNTRNGFNVMEKYPNKRVTFRRHGNLVFVLVGAGRVRRAVTCYEY